MVVSLRLRMLHVVLLGTYIIPRFEWLLWVQITSHKSNSEGRSACVTKYCLKQKTMQASAAHYHSGAGGRNKGDEENTLCMLTVVLPVLNSRIHKESIGLK